MPHESAAPIAVVASPKSEIPKSALLEASGVHNYLRSGRAVITSGLAKHDGRSTHVNRQATPRQHQVFEAAITIRCCIISINGAALLQNHARAARKQAMALPAGTLPSRKRYLSHSRGFPSFQRFVICSGPAFESFFAHKSNHITFHALKRAHPARAPRVDLLQFANRMRDFRMMHSRRGHFPNFSSHSHVKKPDASTGSTDEQIFALY